MDSSAPPPGRSVLEALRRDTAEVHRDLDHSLRVARPGASAADWRRFLAATLGWVEPLEAAFQGAATADLERWMPGVDERFRKAPWLVADLEDLGVGGDAVAALPRAPIPTWSSPAELLGAAYVVEGSTLGGRVLRDLAAAALPGAHLRYWHGYGEATGSRWRQLLAGLEAFGAERPHEVAALRATATETFRLVGGWLEARGCRVASSAPRP